MCTSKESSVNARLNTLGEKCNSESEEEKSVIVIHFARCFHSGAYLSLGHRYLGAGGLFVS